MEHDSVKRLDGCIGDVSPMAGEYPLHLLAKARYVAVEVPADDASCDWRLCWWATRVVDRGSPMTTQVMCGSQQLQQYSCYCAARASGHAESSGE